MLRGMLALGRDRNTVGRLFTDDLRPRIILCAIPLVVSALYGTVLIVAASRDGALHLQYPGRGLLDHFGFWACFVSAPLVVISTYVAVAYFLRLLAQIGDVSVDGLNNNDIQAIVRPHVRSVFLEDRWRSALAFFVFIGVAVSIAIFRQLRDPIAYWGNDVFNATQYRRSYVAANLFLLLTWGVIYPTGLFYGLHITCSTELIVARLRALRLLRLDFLNIDRCAGMAKYGTLNLLVMLIYFWPLAALYVLHMTHRYTYLSLIVGAIGISAVLIVQSVYGLFWISRAITREKSSTVKTLNRKIESAMSDAAGSPTAALATMEYRDRVLSVTTIPYSARISVMVNVLRFVPTAVAAVKLIGGQAQP